MPDDIHNSANTNTCRKCGATKSVEEFPYDKSRKKYLNTCYQCSNARKRARYMQRMQQSRKSTQTVKYNAAKIAQIRAAACAGMTVKEAAELYGYSTTQIHYCVNRYLPGVRFRIPAARKRPEKRSPHVETIRHMATVDKLKNCQIAERLGLTQGIVAGIICRYRISRVIETATKWTPERLKIMANLSALGKSARAIAAEIGESPDAVKSIMYRNGLYAQSRPRPERVRG